MYRALQRKQFHLVSEERVREFFENDNVIDLYTPIVAMHTDWPLASYSLKAIATYLGFSWRDDTPSGALSIQWFNDFLDPRYESTLQRILEYNEDDRRATAVLKDKLVEMNNRLTSSDA